MSETRPPVYTLLWRFTSGHRRSLFGGLALLTAAALIEVCSVLVMADVLDGVLGAASTREAVQDVAAWIGVTAASALLGYLGTMATTRASEGTVLALRDESFSRLVRRPARDAQPLPSGDLVVRLTEDVAVLETAISVSVVQAFVAALTTVGLVGVALWLSWQLTLIALVAVPVLMGIARLFTAPQERVTEAERNAHSDLGSTVGESVSTIQHAQLHNGERAESAEVHRRGAVLLVARLREARVQALFGGILGSAQSLTLIAVSVVGVLLVRSGGLSYGTLMALTGYIGYLYPRIQDIAESRLALVGAGISAQRLTEAVGDLGPAVAETDELEGRPAQTGLAVIDVADLTVRRSDTFELVCPRLRAEAGELTVITGPSGSGKSTLAAVFAGMLAPDSGRVTVAGRPVDEVSGAALRELVTLVAQPAVIRSGTIASNIGYGSPPPDGADVASAARLAGVDEFALSLPDGYRAPTGFGGDEFSGGQRQRIAVARGLARRTPVLVLDEPSTGLDRANVSRLVSVLTALAAERTIVVISHDQRMVDAADRVYRVTDGRVAEDLLPRAVDHT